MYGRERLAETIAGSEITVVPGVYDGISARLVERQGFESGFLSGAGVSNSRLAQPDVGFLTLPDIADQSREIADAVEIPIWVDADTGYGNAVSVHRTIRRLADAGAAAVMIEDQEWPKRCGHMAGKSVVGFEEAVAKIEAAADARDSHAPDMLLKARTDATEPDGLDEAIRRLNAFADAGADVVFADALRSADDIRRVADEVEAPLSVNMGFGVRSRPTTPLIPAARLDEMGVDVVIYPRLITAAATAGMKRGLEELATAVETDEEYEAPDAVVDWDYYTDLVGKPAVDDLEERFATDDD
ncbi:isocitrate lyase/PEP mutase family protein [Halobaculum magnesiiphilum]|uniref:Isocitrate lyase/PEP mutase family protein n=1 Tax=Halobaculum magnesiiphilum TaxID=1017351 RepID=A0A8T8WEJ6_9EURY|nr:isocitrate lyase/PEP mutase family protein [Halobaculum magnesiiphilum]QZP38287.1 isocitrate lyase/PEP mutase family protein [Halobaculum magnesiiphilum]